MIRLPYAADVTTPKRELTRINSQVAQRVRVEMARQGITPNELADATGIDRATLRRRIRKEHPLAFQPHELLAVARHLDCTAAHLLGEVAAA